MIICEDCKNLCNCKEGETFLSLKKSICLRVSSCENYEVIPEAKMKKLFISLPMSGLSEEEIRKRMAEYKENAEYLMGEKLELIDTFIDNVPDDVNNTCVWCLGKSIMMMAEADVVYFGRGWRQARGCIVEYEAAYRYKILRIEDAPYWDKQY